MYAHKSFSCLDESLHHSLLGRVKNIARCVQKNDHLELFQEFIVETVWVLKQDDIKEISYCQFFNCYYPIVQGFMMPALCCGDKQCFELFLCRGPKEKK